MPVGITRDANGISLNAGIREWVIGENGDPALFATKAEAIEYLKDLGFTDEEIQFMKFPSVRFTAEQRETIRYTVSKALGWSMDMYGLDDVIDDGCSDLSPAEVKWAKEHLQVTVVEV